jgi:hypothetical protein
MFGCTTHVFIHKFTIFDCIIQLKNSIKNVISRYRLPTMFKELWLGS